MHIVFDERKRLLNIAKHEGLDFTDLDWEFFEKATIFRAKKDRFAAVGDFRHELLTVIFSRLGSEAFSVVSMRPASQHERKRR